ncbi:MAG: stage III sporulation protein AF [Clostridia bacterium]|nr:stage III sporulation protein AF [Clostridia bacterium]
MNDFFNAILIFSVISGIISSLIINGAIKKYVNYLIGLIMVLVVMSPVFSVLSSINKIEEYMRDFSHSIKTEELINSSNTLIVNTSEERVCNGIKEMVISKFGFEETDVYISLDLDKAEINAIKIRAVNVVLTNKASWSDTDRVKEYLDKTIGCKINVTRR